MKELKVYFMVVLVVTLIWHNKEWIDHPIEQVMGLPYGGAFGIPGIIHPLVFGFFIYLLFIIIRIPFRRKSI